MPTQVTEVKFSVGQVIHHNKFDYRGVIYDIDATFQGTEEWYELVAKSRPPKDKPWYHVLVDQGEHTTYVAERHLEPDDSGKPIQNPMVEMFFSEFENGVYQLKGKE